jgi:hypothetical protein
MKLKVKKTLMCGNTMYTIGQVFEGNLDTFPEDIRIIYFENRWDLIEVIVSEKGVISPKKFSEPVKGEHTSVQPLFNKIKQDSVQVQPGTPVPSPTSVDTTFVKNKDVTDKKIVHVSKGEPGPSTIDIEPISTQGVELEAEELCSEKGTKKKLLKINRKVG